jgi:hypothetical protein
MVASGASHDCLQGKEKSRSVVPTTTALLGTVQGIGGIFDEHFSDWLWVSNEATHALTSAGYFSLDEQAKALGLHRSTAWTIIKKKHKLGRLNRQTAQRILENPDTPLSVRAIVQKALAKIWTTEREQI